MERERSEAIFMARAAEQAERYNDMVEAMNKVVMLNVELTEIERNLFCTAYKNLIGAKRASWQILSSIEEEEATKANKRNMERTKDYRERVEDELSKICNVVLSIIEEHLLPSSTEGESTAFYYKMKGDYYRYLAEFKTGDEREEAADQSLMAYEAATSRAASNLSPTHPIRLGLALNFAVFYHDILNSTDRACRLAREAFDEAAAEPVRRKAESYKDDTTHIMQLFRDNFALWTSDQPQNGG